MKNAHFRAVLAVLSVCGVTNARAEDADAPITPDTSLEESLFEPEDPEASQKKEKQVFEEAARGEADFFKLEEEIVVAASKRAQPIKQAPAKVAVISAEDIKRYGFRSLGEALRTVAGWYVVDNFSFQHAGLRGVNQAGDYGTRILLLVDGHTMNESWSASMSVGEEFMLDLMLVERIEVLQGPSSSLYGSNGYFGILNVVTRQAKETGPFAQIDAGSHGRVHTTAGMNVKFGEDFDLSASVDALDVAGRQFFFPEWALDSASAGYTQEQNDHEQHIAGFVRARYGSWSATAGAIDRSRDTPTGIYESLFDASATNYGNVQLFGELRFDHNFTDTIGLTVRGYYDRYRWTDDIGYGADEDYPIPYVFHDDGHTDGGGAEARLELQLFQGESLTDRLLVGAEGKHARELSRSYVVDDPLEDMVEVPTLRWSAAAYFQNELTWAKNGLLIVGGRFDFDLYDTRPWDYQNGNDDVAAKEVFGDAITAKAFSPRAAVIITPTESTTFKLIYARGFRSGSTYERFFTDDYAIIPAPRTLEAEIIDNGELVYEQDLGEHVRLAASVYRYQARGLISLIDVEDEELGAVQQFDNVQQIDGWGVEVGLRYVGPSGTRAFMNASVQNVEVDKDPADVLNSPPVIANAGLSVPVYQQKLFLSGTANFVASRLAHDAPDLYLSAFAVVNGGILVKDVFGDAEGKGFQVSAFVYNLLDTRYEEVVVEEEVTPILSIPQDRRSFLVKLAYQY